MRSHVIISALAIVLGVMTPIVSAIVFPEGAIAQQNTSEIDRAMVEGVRLFREGNAESLRKAITYFEQVLRLNRDLNDNSKKALAFGWLGSIYSALGDQTKALEYYNQSLPLIRILGGRKDEATTLNNIGGIYSALGEKLKALNYYNQSLPISRTVGDRKIEAATLNNIGNIYDDLGDKFKALDYYNQSLRIGYEIANRNIEAAALNNIGGVYSTLGKKSEALNYYNQSLRISRETRDQKMESAALNNIARIHYTLGENSKALDYYNQSLLLSRRTGSKSYEATTLTNIGAVYDSLGKMSKTLDYYNQALRISREVGDRDGEATTLNNIGVVHSALGEESKALGYFNQSLPIRREIGDRDGETSTLTNIGLSHLRLGEKSKALDYYNQSLVISRSVGNRSEEAIILTRFGSFYDTSGEKSKALDYYNQALPISRSVGDRSSEATILNNIGRVYDTIGKKSKASDYYHQSLQIWRTVGNRDSEATTLNNIALGLAEQKRSEISIIFYKQSVSVYESIRIDNRTLSREQQESYTKTVEHTYRSLADLLLKADRILEAQQVLDLLKVQELNTYLSNVRGKTQELYELPPETEILKKYGEIQTSSIELGQKLTTLRAIPEQTRTKPQQQEIDRLVQLQIELNQQFNTFLDRPDIQKLVQALSPKTLRQTVDTTRLDALRDDLRKLNAVLIYPLILDDRLELIITTPDSPPLRRTVNVKREELNTAIKDFRTVLQNPKQDAKPIAQKLYNWLIKPLEADLKTSKPQTLIYAPDAQLRYIPIAALHDGTQWLTQRYAINHITAQSLTDLTAQPNQAPKILAGAIGYRSASIAFGSDTFNFGGLAYTTKEVQSIQQLQPTTRILDGDAFRLNNVTPKLGDYNILHLATHAALVPKKVENSFILFGSSTYATLRDIESWTLNNFDLVVLSACETGLGGKFGTGGEEILGLGYQFQSRGAKATIASLWQVDDGGTQILMTAFYSALKQGHSKTKALQLAQTALITNDFQLAGLDRGVIRYISKEDLLARSNHPAYWAPFILIGNGL